MKIKILENVKYALGGIDVRDFVKDEEVDIKDAYAYRMIELGLAVDVANKVAKVLKEVEPKAEKPKAEPVKKGNKKAK